MYPSERALLNDIIAALETERIHWPSAFNLMSSEQWIQKMSDDPCFYSFHARNSSEIQEYENILLDLAAQCLKREIQVIPFLEQQCKHSFNSQDSASGIVKKHLTLLSCQTLSQSNFFMSIQLQEKFQYHQFDLD